MPRITGYAKTQGIAQKSARRKARGPIRTGRTSKKKSLASKVHKVSKRVGKASTAVATAGMAGGAGLGKRSILNPLGRKKSKTIEQKLARRSKKHKKAVASGNKKKIAKSERKNIKSANRLGKRLEKRERKNPGSTAKIAAKRAKAGKPVSGAMGILNKASAGARNPAAKPLPSAAAPRASVARKTGLRKQLVRGR